MRAIIILIAVVVLGAIGWLLLGAQDGEPVTGEAVAPAVESAAEAAAETTEATEEAATTAAEEVGTAVEAAGQEAADAVEGAVESATEAVQGAAEAVEGAVNEAVGAAGEAADAAADAVESAAESAADAPAAIDGGDVSLADALTPEGFDADRLREAIQNSDLAAIQKQAAEALVQGAEQNPDLIPSVIEQLRTQLGL